MAALLSSRDRANFISRQNLETCCPGGRVRSLPEAIACPRGRKTSVNCIRIYPQGL
ncbi:MAG: hypothetical protein GDA38_05090 [Hormoscilla sp. SP12CHS1]|nr:hypothetical protein [Hormoscilla sp. SP12CHS1]